MESVPGSFISLHRKWKKNDVIELILPMPLYTVSMPDNVDRRAVFYGRRKLMVSGSFDVSSSLITTLLCSG